MVSMITESGDRFKEPTKEDLKLYSSDDWCHFIGIAEPRRPSALLFSVILEYKFFPPETPKNDEYILLSTEWMNALWMTNSIPIKYKAYADSVASFVGLDIKPTLPVANPPVIASVSYENWEQHLKDAGFKIFPIHGKNMYTLENTKDHPIHMGVDINKWFEFENEIIERIFGNYEWTEKDGEEVKKFKDFMKGN
jgi:hypothetical protein